MRQSLQANLLLLVTAMIWGGAFVAQDVAMDSLGPFSFNGLRMSLAALALLPVLALVKRKARRDRSADEQAAGLGAPASRTSPAARKTLALGGIACGVMLALGSALQQIGISMGTSAGKAGFITALYIVLVPMIGLFSGKRVRPVIWAAVAISAVGLYLLCVQQGFSIEAGDAFLILSAFSFSLHILIVDHFSRKTDCVKMSCVQFMVAAVLSLTVSAFTEHVTWAGIQGCAVALLYAGVLSGAVGYTLQMIAQRNTDPTVASLIMSLESVFAVLAGWLLLGESMSAREYIGCAAMLCGIMLAQWPAKRIPTAQPSAPR